MAEGMKNCTHGQEPLSVDLGDASKKGKNTSFAYIRENSVNESREQYSPVTDEYKNINGELAEKHAVDLKMEPVKIMMYERQTSSSPFVNNTETTFKSNDSKLSDDFEEPILKKFRQLKKCVCCMSACGLFMLTLAIMLFCFLVFITVPRSGDQTDFYGLQTSPIRQHIKTSGNFILNQDRLRDAKEIRWVPDIYSIFEAIADTYCVRITLHGDYFINSRFTFRIPTTEKQQLFTHYIRIEAENEEDNKFMRQYVNIPQDRVTEYRKTSVFTKIFHLQEGEVICAYVSAPERLYASGIDNDLTIVRLNDDVTDRP